MNSASPKAGTAFDNFIKHDILLRPNLALKRQVASSPQKVKIYVIGHSKGGVLSSTLVLWLADTQGIDVPADDQWDYPARRP